MDRKHTIVSILSAAALVSAGSPALADPVVSVDLTGVQIKNATPQNKTSAPMQLDPSTEYAYEIDGMVKGSGLVLGLLFPNPTPLEQSHFISSAVRRVLGIALWSEIV